MRPSCGGPETGAALPVAFAALLRRLGLDVPVGAVLTYAQALERLGLQRRADVYWAGRATLLRRVEDVELYDRAFLAFWEARDTGPSSLSAALELPVVTDAEDPEGEEPKAAQEERPVVTVRYSPVEVLREKDFAACTPAELAEAQRMMARMSLRPALRRSRRLVPGGSSSRRPDLRRTVRAALRSDGEAVRWFWRAPGTRPRRVVLLLDISGSMEPYSRALLRFAHVGVAGGVKVEVFTLGTRLTRITRELSQRDPDAALARAAASVGDWSGGTRLGEALGTFNDQWGVRGMARGAIVVICSDGWDRGDPERLGQEMRRLRRVAHRVVWVNPLKASEGYAPLARGMAAALPSVDDFVEGHSLASLEALSEVIGR